ncbi:hypothetical protein, partial [Flavobacterium sp.]|uniref:hypothetical protein n=1 Tax=Flavobacterium sp. TaxID=239 RepID=UPI002637AC91
MRKKLVLFLITFLGTNSIYSQNEYGILFISDIEARDELQQTIGIHKIYFDNGMLYFYPNQYFTPISGKEDFFYVTPNLTTKKINFNFTSSHRGCFIDQNTEFDIENINNNNNGEIYFIGCFA